MATAITNPGGGLNSVPAPGKQTLQSNYIDFASAAGVNWAQQYVPDLMAQEAEVFGNRTIGGFLEMVGAEEPMTADQVVWSEQGRLHLSYQGNADDANPDNGEYIIHIVKDIDGVTLTESTAAAAALNVGIRVGDLIMCSDTDTTLKLYVTAVGTTNFSGTHAVKITATQILAYAGGTATQLVNTTADATTTNVNVLVYGSEYAKGTAGRAGANTPSFKSFFNNPVIMKDKYEVSGSDASQIGWVEVTGEDGQGGYLWYLKAAGDTKSRFADYVEMMMLESEIVGFSGGIASHDPNGGSQNIKGSEGFFAAVETRGQIFDGVTGDATAAQALEDFDKVIAAFDEQGAIEEYMMFLNRQTSLTVDTMLAGQNSYGSGGTSYGVFDNSEDMALNLGFSGFRRASYDFYKTDWKYLNDKSTRGGLLGSTNLIRGAFVPAGVTTVYDQSLGKNLKRPLLHVRYRSSNMDDRRFKTWTTGSVGAATSDLDAMEMHFLSERCLITQGANNFMLLKGVGTY